MTYVPAENSVTYIAHACPLLVGRGRFVPGKLYSVVDGPDLVVHRTVSDCAHGKDAVRQVRPKAVQGHDSGRQVGMGGLVL